MDRELEDRIRQRAYDLWLENGQPDGSEMDFWLQAERDIRDIDSALGAAPDSATKSDA
jgi:hypothetical protein